MGKVILGVTITMDGFAEEIDGNLEALYTDMDSLRTSEALRKSIETTGAVVMSKKEYEMAEDPDLYEGHYEYQVPIFVFTDEVPEKHPKENDQLSFHFVTEGIKSAVDQAKAAAGDKDVNIIGSALTVQQCLQANAADELHVDIIPIFLKEGRRPFENFENLNIRLERILIAEMPEGRTHIQYKIIKMIRSGSCV